MKNLSRDLIEKAWLEGNAVDWNSLYNRFQPCRMHVPTPVLNDRVYETEATQSGFHNSSEVREEAAVEQTTGVTAGSADIQENLIRIIKTKIEELLEVEEEVETDRPFNEYGVDSVAVVKLVNDLNKILGAQISVTVIYDYPTIVQFAQYIANEWNEVVEGYFNKSRNVKRLEQNTGRSEKQCYTKPAGEEDSIAVIGISGRFAQSDNLEMLWANLVAGKDLVAKAEKFGGIKYNLDSEQGCDRGSFIEGIEHFDPLFFNISGLEAAYIDPQQRLFLEESWKALEDGGYAGEGVYGKKCGVYVGCTAGDYQDLIEGEKPTQALWGNMSSIIPTRIAYLLNLKGPAIAVDTACSSSLVAIHLACQSLKAGESEMALAGGVFLQCTPKLYSAGNKGKMLSRTGACQTFDERADGFVPGDGVGVVVLKPLKKALEDGDYIYGTIVGSGINQDGATNGITAPSGNAQEELEREIYQSFKINPENIQMLEAHGTGTKLGDPIEFEALTKAFRTFTDQKQFCAIGSIKSNLGHTQHAAGVTGLLKVLLAFKHEKIPASIHYKQGNTRINFEDSPFYVNTSLTDWKRKEGQKRLGAVSSFGFSGTNGHLVVEEPPVREQNLFEAGPYLVVLSARSRELMTLQAQQLLNFCLINRDESCGNISYTLLKGRAHFNHRWAAVVDTVEELESVLINWLKNDEAVPGVRVGKTEKSSNQDTQSAARGNECIQKCLRQNAAAERRKTLEEVAELFCKGYPLAYGDLYANQRLSRLPLPVYPFKRERYWVKTPEKSVPEPKSVSKVFHPLLHNVQGESEKMDFKSHFTGEELFFKEHEVAGSHILPGAAYLEMMHSGLLHLHQKLNEAKVETVVKDVTWLRPLSIENNDKDIIVAFSKEDESTYGIKVYKEGDEAYLFCQGKASLREPSSRSKTDLTALRNEGEVAAFNPGEFYETLKTMGVNYGEPYQCIKNVWESDLKTITKLQLSPSAEGTLETFKVHPYLMDAVFQSMVLVIGKGKNLKDISPALLFALHGMKVFGPCTSEMWAEIQFSEGSIAGDSILKLDINVYDAEGNLTVQIEKVSSRTFPGNASVQKETKKEPSGLVGNISTIPKWRPVHVGETEEICSETALIIGGTDRASEAVSQCFADSIQLHLKPGCTCEEFIEALNGYNTVEHVIWLCGEKAEQEYENPELLQLFRTVKAFIQMGYDERELAWTIITHQGQSIIPNEKINPGAAAVHGFVGSLAKEQLKWKVRLIDKAEEMELMAYKRLFNVPYDKRGNAWGYRTGCWFKQEIVPVTLEDGADFAIKDNGVYVIVGGAGDIGQHLTEVLVQKHCASVVWIGRTPAGPEIESKIHAFQQCAIKPMYLSADAADFKSFAEAVEKIKQVHGKIDGVIHAAQVFNSGSVAEIDEDKFLKVVHSKNGVALCLGKVFEKEKLDFILFFSSINVYSKAPEQSAYSASCVFIDTFAHYLNSVRDYDVKVINWGYFKNNIEQKSFLEKTGYGLLDENDIYAGINMLLSSPMTQMSYMKTTSEIGLRGQNLSENSAKYSVEQFEEIAVEKIDLGLMPEFPYEQLNEVKPLAHYMDQLLYQLVWCKLNFEGVFSSGKATLKEITAGCKADGFYEKWLKEMVRLFAKIGFLQETENGWLAIDSVPTDIQPIWEEWNCQKPIWAKYTALKAQSTLVEEVVKVLPDIIRREILATEILFPNSSLELMEAVYKSNVTGHYFNELLANCVAAYVQEAVSIHPDKKIRIIEIGAGTGGTSEVVLEKLKPLGEYIEEYCYTDISQAFLLHAQNQYAEGNPFLTCKLFNLEMPLENQNVQQGSYDIAIAANCLHTTTDISVSIENAKAVLKKNGLLVLNEMNGNDLFSHLIFGMLEGWWLYKDSELRIEGCPGVDRDVWKSLLAAEGFRDVYLPYSADYDAMQEVIVAKSDGILYQRRTQPVQERAQKKENSIKMVQPPEPSGKLYKIIEDYLKEQVGICLKIDPEQIAPESGLAEYGVDSILSVNLVKQFNEALKIEMDITVLFEYSSIDELAKHIAAAYKEQMEGLFGVTEASAEMKVSKVDDVNLVQKDAAAPVGLEENSIYSRNNKSGFVSEDAVAIVGISGKFPGADHHDLYWENIVNEKICIEEIPDDRKALMRQFSLSRPGNSMESRHAGLISKIEYFDPQFFGLSPLEAEAMCPELRLLLTNVWKAMENANITEKTIDSSRIGVFVSSNPSEYGYTAGEEMPGITKEMTGSSIANQISYMLNLRGPSECCETGCSSGLVAIHRAIQSIRSGECSYGIVGGVNLLLSEKGFRNMEALDLLTLSGTVKSFQNGADGFIRSEGVGVVVLKPYSKAFKDGDNIYAVVKGSAVHHGGKGVSSGAPHMIGMRTSIVDAYRKAGVTFRDVDYFEAHGIGNALADSIEMAALKSAFRILNEDEDVETENCSISCLKPSIGHSEIFSGLAAVIKAALAIKNKTIPGFIGFNELNQDINLMGTPFTLTRECRPWTKRRTLEGEEQPRIASVNSYGLGGVNAHIVLTEHEDAENVRPIDEKELCVIPFSASDQKTLKHYAENLLRYVETAQNINLGDLAYTFQTGRTALEERCAILVDSTENLAEELRQFIEMDCSESRGTTAIYIGNPEKLNGGIKSLLADGIQEELLDAIMEKRDLRKLAQCWTSVGDLSWEKLHMGKRRRKISAPTYPFNDEYYWSSPGKQISAEMDKEQGEETAGQTQQAQKEKFTEVLTQFIGVEPEALNRDKTLKDYGVDSMRSITLLQRIQTVTGAVVSLKALHQSKTIEALEALICTGADIERPGWVDLALQYPELVRLNQGGKGQPVFWIHSALGGVETYGDIAEECSRPFYGIQARGWMTDRNPLQGIGEMAAYYAQIIQAVQPEGPYDIGGFCLGGILAYEVTRILQGRGYSVRSLVMIDSPDNTFQETMKQAVSVRNDSKGLIFQTINMLLYAQLGHQKSKQELFIRRDEVDMNLDDAQFTGQVADLARKHGLSLERKEVIDIVTNNVNVQMAYRMHEYVIVGLADKAEPKCYYFRNISGVFEGSLREYLTLPDNGFYFDNKVYWKGWEQQFDSMEIIDVEASSHMSLMQEEQAMSAVLNLCRSLY
jgi:polyketide synthase PksM